MSFEFSKNSKRIKELVLKDYDEEEILIDMNLLMEWGIIPETFPFLPHKAKQG